MRATTHGHSAKRSTKATAAKRSARAARTAPAAAAAAPAMKARTEEERRVLIAQAAYFRAEKRGFSPGQELDDWLAAESEIDGQPLLAHQLAHSDT
jgi:hypothetical protein